MVYFHSLVVTVDAVNVIVGIYGKVNTIQTSSTFRTLEAIRMVGEAQST